MTQGARSPNCALSISDNTLLSQTMFSHKLNTSRIDQLGDLQDSIKNTHTAAFFIYLMSWQSHGLDLPMKPLPHESHQPRTAFSTPIGLFDGVER